MRYTSSEQRTSPGPTFGSHWQTDNISQSESFLDWIINSRRRISERDVRPIAQQLARTLSLMHAHGVVHRNLKLENLFICVNTTTASIFRKARRRAIITHFTFAAVTDSDPASDSLTSVTAPLIARCGQQYNPAPELFRSTHTAQPAPQVGVPISGAYYAGPPVDVWGLGVVLYTLVCGRVPFDELIRDKLQKASVRSPETIYFPRRLSRDCRDLLRRMLQADPAVRASLDEVLNHPWTNSPVRCPRMLPVGADSDVSKLAALKWPDQVDRKDFFRISALDSRNGDDALKNLSDTLDLVSRLCEPCSGGNSRAHTLNLTSRLSRVRDLPDRAWSLLARIRSCAVPDWSIVVWPPRRRRAKMVTS